MLFMKPVWSEKRVKTAVATGIEAIPAFLGGQARLKHKPLKMYFFAGTGGLSYALYSEFTFKVSTKSPTREVPLSLLYHTWIISLKASSIVPCSSL